MKYSVRSGFTLIELSIVLVIVGLLIGAVLSGKDMIKSAKIRKTISEMDKYNAAVSTFTSKYNCMPGDCATATTYFSGAQPGGTTNGNGSNTIDDADPENTTGGFFNTERAYLFDQLASANMINLQPFDETLTAFPTSKAGVYYPAVPVGRGFIIAFSHLCCSASASDWIPPGKHYFFLGIYSTTEGDSFVSTTNSELAAPDAFIIDSKLDDGKPFAGTVQATVKDGGDSGYLGGHLDTAAASGACVSDAAGNPYSSNDANTCALAIRTAF